MISTLLIARVSSASSVLHPISLPLPNLSFSGSRRLKLPIRISYLPSSSDHRGVVTSIAQNSGPGGAAGGAAAYLHSYLLSCDSPTSVKKEEIDKIADRFVTSILPPGNEELRGDEMDEIIKIKSALGIDDQDAASIHMEMGKHIFRQGVETGDREADVEQHQAFQKLIYVSTLVFGEASTFLLPWKNVFEVTDAQVEVAILDNARRLYASKLKAICRDLSVDQLERLRAVPLLYRLSDNLAEDLLKGTHQKTC